MLPYKLILLLTLALVALIVNLPPVAAVAVAFVAFATTLRSKRAIVALTCLTLPFAVLASTGEAEQGIVGSIIIGLLEGVPLLGAFALPVYSLIVLAIGTVLSIICRRILDLLPVTWHDSGVSLYWRLAAYLFGDEVLIRNARLDPKCPELAKAAVRDKLIAKSPILQIKAPWEK